MAVAAYASLVSLTHVLDNLHDRAQYHLPRVDINQLGRLQDNIRALLEFVELHSEAKYPGVGGLWRQISEVGFEAEDRIDFHVVNLLHKRSQGETSTADNTDFLAFCEDMEILISKTGEIKQELLCLKEEEKEGVQAPSKQPVTDLIPSVGSSTTSSGGKDVLVGLEDHVVQIMDMLTRDRSNLKILSITGMGGIGKTTLAKRVFDDPYVVNYFDKRIWLTISQEYSVEQILKGLLNDGVIRGTSESTSVDLGTRLYQHLFDRRYLVVLDDVWTTEAWDDLKRFFPSDRNGSCVMLTTRNSDVAECVGSYNPYPLGFLDEDKSWDLFCENTFSQKGCPYSELEKTAKAIVKSCRGLPLEIVVIGRMLASSSMTREYWESAAKNISSFANLGDNEHCFKILSLSYTSLPIHLKPCFLYMRIFREDARIGVSELIKLWVAEGFIKTEVGRSLEEIGVEYLKNLVARNLVSVKQWTIRRKMESCGMHDLLRDLCLKEFVDENFICSPKVHNNRLHHRDTINFHRVFHGDVVPTKISTELLSAISSSIFKVQPFPCFSCGKKYSSVRMLSALNGEKLNSPELQPTTLRCFLYCEFMYINFGLSSTINLLWNLHTIDIFFPYLFMIRKHFPSEIWEMPQLQKLHANAFILPDPERSCIEGKKCVRLKHLHTLSIDIPDNCIVHVAARIPNVRTLCLPNTYEDSRSLCTDLFELSKLETLDLYRPVESIVFPKSLKKLSLYEGGIPWTEMTIIGSLPNLEELTLSDIKGSEWDPIEGEFLQLKVLNIEITNLVHWRADQDHFPKLEWLRLCSMRSLEAIPLGIGDIPTLHTIQIHNCSDSVVSSAQLIWEDQQSMGNDTLQIHVTTTEDDKYTLGGGC